jgi:hypothetical protein
MSFETVHSLLVSSLSLVLMIIVILLTRKQKISFRYAVGWLCLFMLGLLGALIVPLIGPIADSLNLAPISIMAATAVFVLLMICVQLSVSISGLQHQVRQLAERIALNDLESKNQGGSDIE